MKQVSLNAREFFQRKAAIHTQFPERAVRHFLSNHEFPAEYRDLPPIAVAFRYADWTYRSTMDALDEGIDGLPTSEEMDARTFDHMETMLLGGFHPEAIIEELSAHSPYAMTGKDHLRELFGAMLSSMFPESAIDIVWHPVHPFFAFSSKESEDMVAVAHAGELDLDARVFCERHRKIIAGGKPSLTNYLMATTYIFDWCAEENESAGLFRLQKKASVKQDILAALDSFHTTIEHI